MSKRFFLVSEVTNFYDGHGSPDFGGERKYVSSNGEFDNLDPSKTYNEDLEEVDEDENEDLYSEDGYNCERIELDFREITEEQAIAYTKIINDYENLTTDLSEFREENINQITNQD